MEQLNQLDKLNIEKNNNENFWEQFCNDINNNTNNSNNDNNFLSETENDFEIEKKENSINIINNFFYPKEKLEQKIKEIGIMSGIMKKCGFIEKEVKLMMDNKEKRIDVYDLEKNEIIKKIE